jgi:hypothetical protein
MRRPDLVRKLSLDDEQKQLLDEFLDEQGPGTANGQSARR